MEKNLLPWILGAALIAAGALAATVEFTQPTPTAAAKAPLAPSPAPAATPAPAPTATASSAAAPSAAAPASLPAAVLPARDDGATTAGSGSLNASSGGPQLPPGEVWQCIVNGQKIFSDKRCGNGASVRQIGDLNIMDVPAQAQPPYGMYRPGYAGAPYPAAQSYPDDQDDAGLDSDGYVGQQIIVARERARRAHYHHQNNLPHPPPSHGASGPHSPR
jgi:hypothetical protein